MSGYVTLGYENIWTILLSIFGFIIVAVAQVRVNGAYNRTKRQKNQKGISGQEVARAILDANGLNDIYVVETKGTLSDHYDPTRKVVRLSAEIFEGTSIAALSVAAHECGHAIQDKENYSFMRIRSFLAPIVNFITYIGYIVAFISLFAGITGYLKIGIFLILAAILFQLVTLPVEFDASKRAGEQIKKLGLIESGEDEDVKDMLGAAAMTYVAAFISSLINLLRLVIMLSNRDDK